MIARRSIMVFAVCVICVFVSSPVLAATYKLDPSHSSLIFKAKHFDIGYIYGMFLHQNGTIEYNPEKPGETSIDVTINTDSIFTNQRKRDNHLKGPDFFNAKEYPEMSFRSKKVEVLDDDRLSVTGDLTVRGVTKTINTDIELTGSGEGPQGKFRRGFKTSFTIDRTKFGVDYMPDAISKEISITFTGEAIRQ